MTLKETLEPQDLIQSRNQTGQLVLQVVERQFSLGVHVPKSCLTIPEEHVEEFLRSFMGFLGESACSSLLFHLGKETGKRCCDRFKAKFFSSNRSDEKALEAYLRHFTLGIIKEVKFPLIFYYT